MKNARAGWILLAIGIGICLFAWLGFAVVAHLYSMNIGERLFGL